MKLITQLSLYILRVFHCFLDSSSGETENDMSEHGQMLSDIVAVVLKA
jgi:hypothetical protein